MADRTVTVLIALAAGVLALVGARPYAGSWNDGCRLAPVETLVDYHTLAIDESIFVKVPSSEPLPYPADDANLLKHGTLDKLYIDGHFYSDKPPVLSVLLAGVYQLWLWLGGPTARQRPDLFCYLMTVLSSGVGFILAVTCTYAMGLRLGLPFRVRALITASLALSTFALTYTRHVNSHVLSLGVMSALVLNVMSLADGLTLRRLLTLGTLGGISYSLDLGIGPVLLLCLGGLLLYRRASLPALAVFSLAVVPWLAAHHGLNYAIGGTFKPANTYAEYHGWPGCPFDAKDLTGGWNHSPGHFVIYAAAMLFGKRGLIGHNLPLFLAVLAVGMLLRQRRKETPELLFALAVFTGSWLIYAAFSTNYSGACCSVRWFLPLLPPAFYFIAVLLRDFPTYERDFVVLTAWGAVLGAIMWWNGPWTPRMVPLFWPIQACALVSWFVVRRYRCTAACQSVLRPSLAEAA